MAKVAKDNRPFADQKTSELACTYAALILHDDKQDVDGNKINKLIKAANLKVEPFWAKVFEKALKGKNVSDLLVGGGAEQAPVTSTAAPVAQAAQPKVEEKKPAKVEEPEEDVDMGGLFD